MDRQQTGKGKRSVQAYLIANPLPVAGDGAGLYNVEYMPLCAGAANVAIIVDNVVIKYNKSTILIILLPIFAGSLKF